MSDVQEISQTISIMFPKKRREDPQTTKTTDLLQRSLQAEMQYGDVKRCVSLILLNGKSVVFNCPTFSVSFVFLYI